MSAAPKKKKDIREVYSAIRCKKGFLPFYSDVYLDRTKSHVKAIAGTGMGIFFFLVICVMSVSAYVPMAVFLGMAGLMLVWRQVQIAGVDKKQLYGYQLEEQQIVCKLKNSQEPIAYADVEEAVTKYGVKLNQLALRIPYICKGSVQNKAASGNTVSADTAPANTGYLEFAYEVGNTKMQNHVKDCYKMLREKLNISIPNMPLDLFPYLDRAYFYNNSFRKCVIALSASVAALWLINGIQALDGGTWIFNFAVAIIEYFSLFRMFRSVRLAKYNAAKLEHEMRNRTELQADLKVVQLWHFVVAAVLVWCCNVLIIWGCWYAA